MPSPQLEFPEQKMGKLTNFRIHQKHWKSVSQNMKTFDVEQLNGNPDDLENNFAEIVEDFVLLLMT